MCWAVSARVSMWYDCHTLELFAWRWSYHKPEIVKHTHTHTHAHAHANLSISLGMCKCIVHTGCTLYDQHDSRINYAPPRERSLSLAAAAVQSKSKLHVVRENARLGSPQPCWRWRDWCGRRLSDGVRGGWTGCPDCISVDCTFSSLKLFSDIQYRKWSLHCKVLSN